MFKKMKSGYLIIILAVLMVIYLIVRYSGANDRTFRDKILTIDMAKITMILIKDPKSRQEPVELKLTGGKWVVKSGGQEYPADTNVIKNILRQLSDMPTKRYAGKGSDVCAKFEVTDTSAILASLKASDKTVAELYIGKFVYGMPKGQQQQQMQGRQQKGDMTTYVRMKGEKDVYAVEGYLKATFNGNPDSYRYRSLISVNSGDITRITVDEPGNKKVIDNQGGKWLLNGMTGDSTKIAKYRSILSRMNGSKFVNQPAGISSPSHSIKIEGNNFAPVEIQAYPVADTNMTYVITSSANPGTYFNGKEGGLFKKIWPLNQDLLSK